MSRRAERPLNPDAVRAANQAVWDSNPELEGRKLDMSPGDFRYRRQWMDAYLEAVEATETPEALEASEPWESPEPPEACVADCEEAAPTSEDLARRLASAVGSADGGDVELVVQRLAAFPPHVLQTLIDQGTTVRVCRGSVTDYLEDLRGVRPRGWPEGSTWDSVPGLYRSNSNEVVIATVGHDTDEGAHVPESGEGHGSDDLVVHETAHALDLGGGEPHRSSNSDFTDARDADADTLGAYESQPGAAGRQETYAESAARHYGGNDDDAEDHPNLNEYWESDPVASDE